MTNTNANNNSFSFSAEKMHTFVKGIATGKNYLNTLKALEYAREKHKDQKRKVRVTLYCASFDNGLCSNISIY